MSWEELGKTQIKIDPSQNAVQLSGSNVVDLSKMAYRVSDLVELTIPTYDGSGIAVHPDVVYIPKGFGGHKYWMVMTPLASDLYENASVLYSDDGITWSDDGISNPIAPEPEDITHDFNRDPAIVYNEDSEKLWIYWTNNFKVSPGTWQTYRSTSSDGITWSAPEPIERVYNQPGNGFGAVGIVWDPYISFDGAWVAYDTRGGGPNALGREISVDGLKWYVGAKALSSIKHGIHHLSVMRYGGGYHFLAPVGAATKGSHFSHLGALYYGFSKDGYRVEWDSAPLLIPPAGVREMYRSCMIPLTEDTFRVYASYWLTNNTTKIGYFDIKLTGQGNRVPLLGETPGEKMELDLCTDLELRSDENAGVLWNKHNVGPDAVVGSIPLWDKFKKKTLVVNNTLGVDVTISIRADMYHYNQFQPVKYLIKNSEGQDEWVSVSVVVPSSLNFSHIITEDNMPPLKLINWQADGREYTRRIHIYVKAASAPETGTLSMKLIMEN